MDQDNNPILILRKWALNNIVSRSIIKYRTLIFRGYLFLAIVLFVLLAILARFFPYFPFDPIFTLRIQSYNYPVISYVMQAVSYIGQTPQMEIIIGLILLGLYIAKLKIESAVGLIDAVGVAVIGTLIKLVVARPRPDLASIKVFAHVSGPSFPSGHTFSYTAFFGFLLFLIYTLMPHSKLRGLLIFILLSLILLVGPSRIFLGEHWASDVIGAYLLGTLWLYLMILTYTKLRTKIKQPIVSSPVSPQADNVSI